jgi:hypothetical protein
MVDHRHDGLVNLSQFAGFCADIHVRIEVPCSQAAGDLFQPSYRGDDAFNDCEAYDSHDQRSGQSGADGRQRRSVEVRYNYYRHKGHKSD